MKQLIVLLALAVSVALAQPSCNLSNITTAIRIAPSMFPYTSPTSGITVSAATSCPTYGNVNYTCGATTFACSPTAWGITTAAQFITFTFSCPVTEFSVVFNGTNTTEEFYFNAPSGTISLSNYCPTGYTVTGAGNQLLYSGAPASGNMVTVSNPAGSNTYTITHNGLGFGSRITLLDCFTCGPLPVQFNRLSAEFDPGRNRNLLEWELFQDGQQRSIFIEHSTAGTAWDTLDVIEGTSSTGLATYSAIHPSPKGGTHFYRIRSVEPNGNFLLSEIREVLVPVANDALTMVPNPSTGQVFFSSPATEGLLQIMDATGRIVLEEMWNGDHVISLEHLPRGAYMVQLVQDGHTFANKLILTD